MSDLRTVLQGRNAEFVPGTPEAEYLVRVTDIEDAAAVLHAASQLRLKVLIWGAGTHQGRGEVDDVDLVLVTTGLDAVIDYEPDDLTLVVGGGVTLGSIEALLVDRLQSAILPEDSPDATIGGVIAAGISGWRRLRYGPTRDRVLETTIATGDGRVVRGGGRVVKNVSGYDIPKLITGSLGSLGVIGSVCLKLWPSPPATATVDVDDPAAAKSAYRPLAVIQTNQGTRVLLGGTRSEVDAQIATLDGVARPGLEYPTRLASDLGGTVLVPPRRTADAVAMLIATVPGVEYQAAHGVGEIRFGVDTAHADAVLQMRTWTETAGGWLIRTAGDAIEPWGTPPHSVALQRKVKEAFDPIGVCNPGRLPGGL